MQGKFKHRFLRPLVPYFLLAVAVIAAYKVISDIDVIFNFISAVWAIIKPFFYGFMLAYVLSLPSGGIQKLLGKTKVRFFVKRQKGIAILITYILFLLIIYWAISLVIPYIESTITLFRTNFFVYYNRASEALDYLNSLEFFNDVNISFDRVLNVVRDYVVNFRLEDLAQPISAIVGVSSSVFNIFLTFITSIYVLFEKERAKKLLGRMLSAFTPSKVNEFITRYATRLNKNFKQYVVTVSLAGAIVGSMVTIELLILRSPYFLLLGLMMMLMNYIPYFGSIIGTIIAVFVVAFTQGLSKGAITAAVLIITQQLDGNVIQPKLFGGSFKMSPLLIIISVTVGGAFGGVLGMIVAIPIVAVLKDMLENIIAYFETRKNMNTGKIAKPDYSETEDTE